MQTRMIAVIAAALAIFATSAHAGIYEPAPFENDKPVRFTEPTLGCPNVDDAHEAYKQTADWAKSRGCKYLDTNLTWIVIQSGKSYQRDSGRTTVTSGCVIPQGRLDQRDRSQFPAPLSLQFNKECWNVVRRVDQVSARAALPTCTDPVVKDVLVRVARAKEVYTVKEVDSNGLDGRRWCYASFSAPYPGPNGSDQEASFTLEWKGGDSGQFWLQIREQYRTSPLTGR